MYAHRRAAGRPQGEVRPRPADPVRASAARPRDRDGTRGGVGQRTERRTAVHAPRRRAHRRGRRTRRRGSHRADRERGHARTRVPAPHRARRPARLSRPHTRRAAGANRRRLAYPHALPPRRPRDDRRRERVDSHAPGSANARTARTQQTRAAGRPPRLAPHRLLRTVRRAVRGVRGHRRPVAGRRVARRRPHRVDPRQQFERRVRGRPRDHRADDRRVGHAALGRTGRTTDSTPVAATAGVGRRAGEPGLGVGSPVAMGAAARADPTAVRGAPRPRRGRRGRRVRERAARPRGRGRGERHRGGAPHGGTAHRARAARRPLHRRAAGALHTRGRGHHTVRSGRSRGRRRGPTGTLQRAGAGRADAVDRPVPSRARDHRRTAVRPAPPAPRRVRVLAARGRGDGRRRERLPERRRGRRGLRLSHREGRDSPRRVPHAGRAGARQGGVPPRVRLPRGTARRTGRADRTRVRARADERRREHRRSGNDATRGTGAARRLADRRDARRARPLGERGRPRARDAVRPSPRRAAADGRGPHAGGRATLAREMGATTDLDAEAVRRLRQRLDGLVDSLS